MGMASGKGQEEEGCLTTLMFSRIALTASARSGHMLPGRRARQQHLQHRTRGSSCLVCAISTGCSSKPDITSGCVCLKTVKDGKWLPQQVNTSWTEKITSSNPNPKGTALKILRNEIRSHRVPSAALVSLQHQDFTSRLHTWLRRKKLTHFCFEFLFKIRWCNLVLCVYRVALVGKIMLKSKPFSHCISSRH